MTKTISIGKLKVGGNRPFVLFAGPCVIESKAHAVKMARAIKAVTDKLGVGLVFKASFDKANRTSISSYRGPGMEEGLRILAGIKKEFGVPVVSDIHEKDQVGRSAEVLDILQIPAFLSRQTDLILKAAQSGRVVNVKKGQFLAPWDVEALVKKIESTGHKQILLTERGASFGYNNLVVDFRSLGIMRKTGYPVVFDATHSVQQPGGLGNATGGTTEYIPLLSRAGVAAGLDALFMEVHDNPKKALSDGPNQLELKKLAGVLKDLIAIDKIAKKRRDL